MITEIHIQNYKSHKDTQLRLSPLTLLTGVNGSGKSSIIQSLLLLRQSHKRQRLNEALILNDSLCAIGTGKDAIYQSAEDDFVQFTICSADKSYSWKYAAIESKDFLPAFDDNTAYSNLSEVSLFTNDFQYLSAGRLPEFKYEREDLLVENEKQISQKRGYGELVAQFLYHYGEKVKVNPALLNSNSSFDELIHQVTAWEREISPNVNVIPKKIGDTYTVYYSFDKNDVLGTTDLFKSENVAFGLNYALPVITALLSAKPGAILLIENPEAHLHPKGQSKLAELIALAAKIGIQVCIETHSDHIFNGIRKAIAKSKIDKEQVKIHYFELDETNTSIHTEVNISDKGRVLDYKKGLFDQFDDDLDALLGL